MSVLHAQENLPTDYLSKEFHKGRREAFRNLMPANSVAVVFSYPERVFSKDVNYVFHQNPDMYYLTGYKEPDAVLLLFKDMQGAGADAYNEVFFAREKDPSSEMWTGRRLGAEGVKAQLGFTKVYTGKAFKDFAIDYKKFAMLIYDDIAIEEIDKNNINGLGGLQHVFKEKGMTATGDPEVHRQQQLIAQYITPSNLDGFIKYEKKLADENKALADDPIIKQVLARPDSAALESIKRTIRAQKWGMDIYEEITTALREIKTTEEIGLMRKTVKISSLAHAEVMKAVTPAMGEREVEGIHLYIHNKWGAEDEGYPPIVGAGANGCILHYEENSNTKIDNQLLLMDVGAEYHGYSADVTRTIPANGKFSDEQKAIYQLVYDAQEAVFKVCKPGTPFSSLNDIARDVLAAGLIKLGIIKTEDEVGRYYPHGCSHYLGLDVHDKGNYESLLKENMVFTVEPGIYIPAGSKCDKKWWNIAVRIEDDVLINKAGFELLSADAPRKWSEIEKTAALKSKLE